MRKIHFRIFGLVFFVCLLGLLWILFPSRKTVAIVREAPASSTGTPMALVRNEPILPIPREHGQDPAKVELGRKLFHDTRLSKDGSVSCATCHDLRKGGVDGLRFSLGFGGMEGTINSPTVFNSGFNFKQFWDGRADSLEDQIDGPISASHEMNGATWPDVIGRLSTDSELSRTFASIYPDGVSEKSIKDALATFERSLITPDSRFDKWLRGEDDVLSAEEKEGYRLFKDMGCIVCHQGVNVGGNMFQTFGKFGDYFADRGDVTKADWGRMNVTGDERDRYKFKVPSLRNVELTAPYFHDGTVRSIDESVSMMARYQLGLELSPEETKAIVQFLKSLTGVYEEKPLEK